eukprot:maker-scaffold11_size778918-snap-gene-5.22 protein:Tk03675 transcript:maker-scaffold11_size778918-snap-gene-5.22-mRNA-1 annotation:"chitinase"
MVSTADTVVSKAYPTIVYTNPRTSKITMRLFLALIILAYHHTEAQNVCGNNNNGQTFPDPADCSKFFVCHGANTYRFSCPASLLFNPLISNCDWPRNVDCSTSGPSTAGTTPSTSTTSDQTTTTTDQTTTTTDQTTTTTDQTTTTSAMANCTGNKKVVCYYPNWAYWRTGMGKYLVDDIDFTLCTHVVYAFAVLGEDFGLVAHDVYLDLAANSGLDNYRKFANKKALFPNTKFLIAVGGWTDSKTNEARYQKMFNSQTLRAKFVTSALDFIQKYNFDGLDLDYEFPLAAERTGFALWAQELKQAFAPRGYELTAAVSPGEWNIRSGLDIPSLSQSLDAIHIMAYDYHGSWESQADHHAPLYRRSWDQTRSDIEHTVNILLELGAPSTKLVLGMPTYGKSFTVSGPNGAPPRSSSGGGTAGPITKQTGTLGFMEICLKIQNEGWTLVDDVSGPYAYQGDQWVGFDTVKSIQVKSDFVIQRNLGGAMIWDLSMDDFSNQCGFGKNPLLKAINQAFSTTNTP